MKALVTVAMLLTAVAASAQTTSTPAAAPAARKLALDHGPRATSTPWLNQRIREREAAQRARTDLVQAAAANGSAKH